MHAIASQDNSLVSRFSVHDNKLCHVQSSTNKTYGFFQEFVLAFEFYVGSSQAVTFEDKPLDNSFSS